VGFNKRYICRPAEKCDSEELETPGA